jgi:hypothetical protein
MDKRPAWYSVDDAAYSAYSIEQEEGEEEGSVRSTSGLHTKVRGKFSP